MPDGAKRWLDALIGDWETRGSHPQVKEPVRGRASFEWLTGDTFLIWRAEQTPDIIPTFIAILGDVTKTEFPLNYFDSRGVARVYTARIAEGGLVFWRDEPGFAQRARVSIDDHGSVRWETELNGRPDLEMTYRRGASGGAAPR